MTPIAPEDRKAALLDALFNAVLLTFDDEFPECALQFCACPDTRCNCGTMRLDGVCAECQAGEHVYVPEWEG